MRAYDHRKIEKKWQKEWEKKKLYKAKKVSGAPASNSTDHESKKSYVLDMFPYPSGEGLHVGHPKGYIATDIYSRFKRMSGFNVLHPMGWDAFGLPAENYAIKNKVHPRKSVEKNIANYKEQLSIIGLDYDWSREINTTDPEYYRWTQWIFLKLYEKGLAYQSFEPINWCPSCQTGLANEDLEDGKCERCGSVVEKKPMRQWVLKITEYAERLLGDLDTVNWPESIKESQRNWIGKSEGSLIKFKIGGNGDEIEVFTTRPETLFGVTFIALAPEHELVEKISKFSENKKEIAEYAAQAKNKGEVERTNAKKQKTGVEIRGIFAVNPISKEKIPVFVADYVLTTYGTGAVMGVPAHDLRDAEFAGLFGFYPKPVVVINDENKLINSGKFDGLDSEAAKKEIVKAVGGRMVTKYRLRDWVFSRQRYWGEPIPVIHCEKCGVVLVPEKDLPVKLPEVKNYAPTGTGESPLADIEKWVNVKCPTCGGNAKRETNTMPQWAGSSWYYLRYMDPKNKKALVDPKLEKYWAPVDMYIGGAEHATRHLIYARFWHKFLYDIGITSTIEPFARYNYVGLILGEDGRKMSKRFGNVINPNDMVDTYGADTFRIYEMFMGPFSQSIAWDTKSIIGSRRFIERVWRLIEKVEEKGSRINKSPDQITQMQAAETALHKTIKKVTEDIEKFSLNTCISAMMMLSNEIEKLDIIPRKIFEGFLKLLAPFAPHMTEELWTTLGNKKSIHISAWPVFDSSKITEKKLTIAIQINGKTRGEIIVDSSESEEIIKQKAIELEITKKWLESRPIKKIIYVRGRLINIVG